MVLTIGDREYDLLGYLARPLGYFGAVLGAITFGAIVAVVVVWDYVMK
jgi:hypothetical protein